MSVLCTVIKGFETGAQLYVLLNEILLMYEAVLIITSIFYLQFPTQNSLSEGMIPVFYHDKIPARNPGEARNAVLLSILL